MESMFPISRPGQNTRPRVSARFPGHESSRLTAEVTSGFRRILHTTQSSTTIRRGAQSRNITPAQQKKESMGNARQILKRPHTHQS